MPTECGMNDESGGNLEPPVDDFGFPGEHFTLNFREGLRRVAADRASCAGLRRRSYLRSADRIDSIYRADVSAVKLGRIRCEEVDRFQLFFLDVEDSVRELVQLAGM